MAGTARVVAGKGEQAWRSLRRGPGNPEGESGFGRVHGPDGLREFTRPKALTRQRFPLPFGMQSFDRPGFVLPAVRQAMRLRHGHAPRARRR
jgi:hypothetical protein